MVDLTDWGRLKDGTPVTLAQLQDEAGHLFRVMSYGATLTSIRTPDRSGSIDDVLLGFDDLEHYCDTGLQANWPYLGATVGRYANRIAEGRFTIDDRVVQLDRNDGPNQNHGGPQGFDRKPWAMAGASRDGRRPSPLCQPDPAKRAFRARSTLKRISCSARRVS